MHPTILIIGGNGLVGKKIAQLFKRRHPGSRIFTGGRRRTGSPDSLLTDVTRPETLDVILTHGIALIVLSVNDPEDHVLHFAISHNIDYVDITKPTPDMIKAYERATAQPAGSRIVLGSGWMGGIVPGLIAAYAPLKTVQAVKVFVYYSVRDQAGESSAHFMAAHVASPFLMYRNNKAVPVRHFLDAEPYRFSFGIGSRQTYNFDVPDLYILNRIEQIPDVTVKTTYSSRTVTWLLKTFQRLRVFGVLSLQQRRKIFSVRGTGDQAVFEIVFKQRDGYRKVSLKSAGGQAALTALSAVLHMERVLSKEQGAGVYFAHQLHQPEDLLYALQQHEGIQIAGCVISE